MMLHTQHPGIPEPQTLYKLVRQRRLNAATYDLCSLITDMERRPNLGNGDPGRIYTYITGRNYTWPFCYRTIQGAHARAVWYRWGFSRVEIIKLEVDPGTPYYIGQDSAGTVIVPYRAQMTGLAEWPTGKHSTWGQR